MKCEAESKNTELKTFESKEPEVELRDLSRQEVEEVSGGVVEMYAAIALSNYLYYKWAKANDKI